MDKVTMVRLLLDLFYLWLMRIAGGKGGGPRRDRRRRIQTAYRPAGLGTGKIHQDGCSSLDRITLACEYDHAS